MRYYIFVLFLLFGCSETGTIAGDDSDEKDDIVYSDDETDDETRKDSFSLSDNSFFDADGDSDGNSDSDGDSDSDSDSDSDGDSEYDSEDSDGHEVVVVEGTDSEKEKDSSVDDHEDTDEPVFTDTEEKDTVGDDSSDVQKDTALPVDDTDTVIVEEDTDTVVEDETENTDPFADWCELVGAELGVLASCVDTAKHGSCESLSKVITEEPYYYVEWYEREDLNCDSVNKEWTCCFGVEYRDTEELEEDTEEDDTETEDTEEEYTCPYACELAYCDLERDIEYWETVGRVPHSEYTCPWCQLCVEIVN